MVSPRGLPVKLGEIESSERGLPKDSPRERLSATSGGSQMPGATNGCGVTRKTQQNEDFVLIPLPIVGSGLTATLPFPLWGGAGGGAEPRLRLVKDQNRGAAERLFRSPTRADPHPYSYPSPQGGGEFGSFAKASAQAERRARSRDGGGDTDRVREARRGGPACRNPCAARSHRPGRSSRRRPSAGRGAAWR